MIDTRAISVVFQGKLPLPASPAHRALGENIARLRVLLPGAPVMLGTWAGCTVAPEFGLDHVAYADDPGPLPSFKRNAGHVENNVNRQLVGTAAVLQHVATPYVLKLRLDTEVSHVGFLDWYARYGKNPDGRERIAVAGFFTLDPRMYERMPFHVSDWFGFGPTTQLCQLWSAPLMTAVDATWYDLRTQARNSTYFDRRYRAKFAIEQHIASHYARTLDYLTPAFHNDCSAGVLNSHDRFMEREMLVLDPHQYGLSCRSYPGVTRSSLQYFNCLSFLDWYLLNVAATPSLTVDQDLYAAALARRRRKDWMRRTMMLTDPLMPLVRQPLVKACVSKVLRAALRLA
jgi:hypothetical protein